MQHKYLVLTLFALSCDTGGKADAEPTSPPVDDGITATTASVPERNNHPSRDGVFVQPTLTKARAATMVRDLSFDGTISGNVFASPLFVDGSPGVFVIATENNQVSVLDETTGKPVWQRSYGQPAGATGAGCGNISPLGITGTPTIDLAKRTIYFDAAIGTTTTITDHLIHAVSLDDGSERAGWPVSSKTVVDGGERFNPVLHNQRSSLLLVNGILYVTYSGHLGDCGNYRGWVFGIDTTTPTTIKTFKTGATRGGGMWATGGPSTDGTNVFVTTGNTFGATAWARGEAVIRLQSGPVFSGQTGDFFAPTNWPSLDSADLDLGGSGSLVVNAPAFTPSQAVLAFGKDGNMFALDRTNLGGIGAQKAVLHAMNGQIVNASAAVTTASGTFVTMHGARGATALGCPVGSGDLATVKLSGTTIAMAWCANNGGQGSPVITTTDPSGTEAIVWSAGAAGTNQLHAWDAVTGAVVFNGGSDTFAAVRPFTSPIAVKGRIVIAGDNKVYAFKPR
jgi:hypothetical protein